MIASKNRILLCKVTSGDAPLEAHEKGAKVYTPPYLIFFFLGGVIFSGGGGTLPLEIAINLPSTYMRSYTIKTNQAVRVILLHLPILYLIFIFLKHDR